MGDSRISSSCRLIDWLGAAHGFRAMVALEGSNCAALLAMWRGTAFVELRPRLSSGRNIWLVQTRFLGIFHIFVNMPSVSAYSEGRPVLIDLVLLAKAGAMVKEWHDSKPTLVAFP